MIFDNNDRIFITGGTGFLGRSILDMICKNIDLKHVHFEILILSRNPTLFLDKYPVYKLYPFLRFVQGNILDPNCLNGLGQFQYILHAAADTVPGVNLCNLDRYNQIVIGTKNLLDFSKKQTNLKKFLYVSSGAVYGKQNLLCSQIDETHISKLDISNTKNSYALGKHAAESMCKLYEEEFKIPTTIVRLFAFSGSYLPLNAHFAIGNFLKAALNGDDICISGNPNTVRSYLDQKDMAEWVLAAMLSDIGDIYNIGSNRDITISKLAAVVRELINPEIKIKYLDQNKTTLETRYVPDISKISKILGVKQTITLEDSLLSMAISNKKSFNQESK